MTVNGLFRCSFSTECSMIKDRHQMRDIKKKGQKSGEGL